MACFVFHSFDPIHHAPANCECTYKKCFSLPATPISSFIQTIEMYTVFYSVVTILSVAASIPYKYACFFFYFNPPFAHVFPSAVDCLQT